MSSDIEFSQPHDEFEGLNFGAISDPTVTSTTTQATSSTSLVLLSSSITNDRDRSRIYISRLNITPPSSECSNADGYDAEDDESETEAVSDRLVQDKRHSESITLTSLRGLGNISPMEQHSFSQISPSVSERIQRYGVYHLSHATSEPVLPSRFFEAPAESSRGGLTRSEEPLNPTLPKTPIRATGGNDIPTHTPRKKERTTSSPVKPNSSAKAKEAEPDVKDRRAIREILAGFEHEMACPICCDIFVAAHLGNPCGHSFCGECGWEWISKHKYSPTCAICRAKLSVSAPMIPNFTLDSAVTRHLEVWAASGAEEWQPNGTRIVEWKAKKEKWDKGLPMRTAEAKRQLPDIDDNDDYTSDESVLPPVLLQIPAYQNMVYTGVEVRPSHEPRTSNREPQLRRVSWWRRRALMSFFGVVML